MPGKPHLGNHTARPSRLVALAVGAAIALTGCDRSAPAGQSAPAGRRATASATVYAVTGTQVVASPAPIDFGPVVNTATVSLRIQPAGTDPVQLTSIATCDGVPTSPEFTFVAPALPLTLDPAAAVSVATVSVKYTTTGIGATDTGCLRITSAVGAVSATLDVNLSADGMTAANASSCTVCHGNPNSSGNVWAMGAPPWSADNQGPQASLPSDVRVGAHQQHVNNNSTPANGVPLSKPFYCNNCHAWPLSPTHKALLGFQAGWSALASGSGTLTPEFVTSTVLDPATGLPASATCSNVYCHGATLGGGSNKTPTWTKVGQGEAACGACHGLPPPVPHPQPATGGTLDCGGCHGPGYSPTTVNAETHVNGILDVVGGACNACHGDPNRAPQPVTGVDITPAPPQDPEGNTTTAAPGVGAHLSHLTGTNLRSTPVACSDCHAYPPAAPHPNGTVQFSWSALAADGLPAGTYGFNPTNLTCAVYCHGATISGGIVNGTLGGRPIWNVVNGTQAACGTCHGIPPFAPHPNSTQCGGCHPGYTAATVNKATHIDGQLQLQQTCNVCHGTPGRTGPAGADAHLDAAPPADTHGNTATTAPGVGAHLAHVTGTRLKNVPVQCADCHPLPGASHPEGSVVVTLVSGSFDSASLTCGAVACHGGALSAAAGGTNRTPSWTTVDGTQAACGTCHGAPPVNVPPHYAGMATCNGCHPGYTPTSVNPATHIDGAITVGPLSCSSCHGAAGRAPAPVTGADISAAPPIDTKGSSATTAPGVGAHQAHLTGTTYTAAPVACATCHTIPTSTSHSNGVVDVALPSGSFSASSFTCSGVSCHGGALSAAAGGTNRTPDWTKVDGTQDACGTCHGVPPVAVSPHYAGMTSCDGCHAGYTPTSVNKATHLNGVVDVAASSCSACHGDATRAPAPVTGADISAAPPTDTHGSSATTAPGVGAHQSHLTGTTFTAAPVACTSCHVVPTSFGHANGAVNVTLPSGAFSFTSFTCSGVACHGGALPIAAAGTVPTPSWIQVGTGQAACGACHGVPPVNVPPHRAGMTTCDSCHPGYSPTSVDKATHLNGTVDVSGSCTACHGDDTRQPASIAPAPPLDTLGNSATTFRGVGAHQAHLTTTDAVQITCAACHPTPVDTKHVNGVVAIQFGLLATADKATATWDGTSCSNYCHGSTLGSGSDHTPIWTTVNGTQAACGTCHGRDSSGRPNTGRHYSESAHSSRPCTACHAGTSAPDRAYHVNGTVDMNPAINWNPANRSCNPSCHGSESWGGTFTAIAPTLYASPGTVLFGEVTAGGSDTETVTIGNLGTSSLTVTGLTLCAGSSPAFSLSSTAGFTLAAGASKTVTVTFGPTAETSYTGCFTIASSDTAHNPTRVDLVGQGSAPVVPGVPTSISTSNATSSSLTVTWSAAANAVTYELQRDTSSTFGSASLVDTTGLTGTSASATGLAAGTTYYFRVRAISSTGTPGAWSSTATGTTATVTITPGTPSSISTSNRTSSSMTVSWSSATNAVSYQLQRDTASTFATANLVTTAGLTGTSTSVTGLAAGTTYYFRVRAVSSTGTAGAWSPTATGATTTVTPGTPSSISTSNRAATSMTVSWSSATNAATYELQRDTSSSFGSTSLVDTTGLTGTSASVTGLNPSTTYYFRVRGVSSTGTAGAWSPTASGATSSAPVISATPSPLAFGSVSRYSTRTLTLTVRNSGTATLNVTSVGLCTGTSTEFSVSSSGFSVSAGGTRSVSVSYRPTVTGTDTGCVSFQSNDAAHSPYLVSVSGTGQ